MTSLFLAKSCKIIMFLFPGKLWRSGGSNKPSRIPSNAPKTAIWNLDRSVSGQSVSLHLWWLKSIASPPRMWRGKVSVFKMFTICIFPWQRMTRLNKSSSWSQWPPQQHGSHLRACQTAERWNSIASHINFAGVLCLRQYGLTFAKLYGSMEEERQHVVWSWKDKRLHR